MNAQEMQELLGELERLLPELGLGSIVDQELTSAAEGRTEAETTRRKRQSTAPSSDVRVVGLAIEDRIAALLDLLEVAVGGTFTIEESVIEFVTRQELGRGVSFSPDRYESSDVRDIREWTTPDRERLEPRREAVREVIMLVDEIRSATGLRRAAHLELREDLTSLRFDAPGGWA